jgi:hypothetical protein
VPPASQRTARQAEFRELIDLPTVKFSVQAAERLWELGIQTVGTRVDATKRLAWHFCNVQRLPQSETEEKLIGWVYRTGARTSQDVQKDLAKATRDVAKQTRKIIEWIYAHPPTHERHLPSCLAITRAEREHFEEQLAKNFVDDHPQLLDFLCHFLRYAKKHGVPTEGGWNVYVTAGKVKQPHYYGMRGFKPFAFAGLWQTWSKGEWPVDSCTIMTTSANELVGEIYDRMPVILSSQDYDLWLDPEMQDPAKLKRLYQPFPAFEMESYLVSTNVNKVANQGPELIEPIASQGGLF